MTPTSASVLSSFSHGKAAITENKLGNGTAVILGYAASDMCFRPGNDRAEQKLVKYSLGTLAAPYFCEGAIVYRLASPGTDHYFLINDGPSATVSLDTKQYTYKSVTDAITDEALEMGKAVSLEPYSGRWLRFEK